MADIINPQAVKFANEKARVLADAMVECYESARAFKAAYDANTMDTAFPNTADNVADGSDVDGRGRITGARMRQLYSAAAAQITWYETGSPTRIDILRTVNVNGKSRI